MNDKLKIKTSKQKGFTLLLSLLVISIILSVSFGVFDVMTKELKLSGIGRESQISFYAADAGIECAYFWDIKHPDFTESVFEKTAGVNISCGGGEGIKTLYDEGIHSFSFDMGKSNDKTQKCAEVSVTKVIGKEYTCDSDKTCKDTTTTIKSRGYNYSCESKSLHKVERAIKVVSTKTEQVD